MFVARECGSLKGIVDEVKTEAKIAQLGERMTEDHKVRCSIHLLGAFLCPPFLAVPIEICYYSL